MTKHAMAWEMTAETISQLFEHQVKRTPDATALQFEAGGCTYAELNADANRLARVLVSRGVGPERIVVTIFPRSREALVAMIAIAKAGGAFLPVDPAYPADRIAFMMTDARPTLVLAAEDAPVPGICPSNVVAISALSAAVATADPADLTDADRLTALRPEHQAYVIYTSGSTGRPKGVVVTHQGIPSLVQAQAEAFGIGPESRVLQFASLSFDAAVAEIFVTLLRGATLVVAAAARLSPGLPLSKLITASGVTHVTLPPAVLPLQEGDAGLPAALTLIVAGEACPAEVAARWSAGRTMINAYGPTEYTVCATLTGPLRGTAKPSIGRPIINTRVYVMDPDLDEIADGTPGEILIAGSGVARGYLRRPGLTAARFLPDPLGPPGGRLYRTGDLGRWRPDGELDFLGRADDQISIHGYRVEPGEIEAALLADGDTRLARVVARGDGDATRLVAYVVPAAGTRIQPALLRRRLADKLPSHLIPAAFVELDHLPLNANGKLDRAALPQPEFRAESARAIPGTPQEEVLCRLFAEVLSLPVVGVTDNFFELGGDSLLAARLAARVRATLGAEISVRSVIEAGTPAAIARGLGIDSGGALGVILPLRAHGTRAPLFCVHPAGGLSWCYTALLQHIDGAHPVFGIQARGLCGQVAPHLDFNTMVDDYFSAIREIQPHGPYNLLGWSFGGLIAHALAGRCQQADEQVGLLALLDAYPEIPAELRHDNSEAAFLTDMLHFINVPVEGANGSLTRDTALSLARTAGSALASLDSGTIERLVDVFDANHQMLRYFQAERVNGDMVFFAAHGGLLVEQGDCASWQKYLTGRIWSYQVNCEHRDMTGPEAMAQIGPVLARHLTQKTTAASG